MPEINYIETKLVNTFPAKHIKAVIEHFVASTDAFQRGNWESCVAKGGKFIEAVLKSLSLHVGNQLPPARQFKVNAILNTLKALGVGTFNDAIRITIPRACEFAYDIASNRGARHDPNEVDPNEMDATIMVATTSWILAELIRYSQKRAVDQSTVKELIQGIVQRRFPAIEDVDGRTYFHFKGISGREIALLALWYQHPKRMSKVELLSAIIRHGFSKENANISINRITRIVDIDSDGNYRLLAPGLIEAEKIGYSR